MLETTDQIKRGFEQRKRWFKPQKRWFKRQKWWLNQEKMESNLIILIFSTPQLHGPNKMSKFPCKKPWLSKVFYMGYGDDSTVRAFGDVGYPAW